MSMKRYRHADVPFGTCSDWCKYSDVEQLEQENRRFAERSVDDLKALSAMKQERDQLAATLEATKELVLQSIEGSCSCRVRSPVVTHHHDICAFRYVSAAKKLLNESPATSLREHDKALLLRLADDYLTEVLEPGGGCFFMPPTKWLIKKAEEL